MYVTTYFSSASGCLPGLKGDLDELIRHGLHALRETLQQDKELNVNNTSIGIVGPASPNETDASPTGAFRILEGDKVDVFVKTMIPKETDAPAAPTTTDEDVQMAE